jgi:hypothetical protein
MEKTPLKKRTICIGDVHGCGLELQFLLKQCKIRPGIDIVYLVGDIFDRGMHGHIVWQLIQEYGIKVLRGNHEQKFIKYFSGGTKSLPPHYYWAINNLVAHGVKVQEFVDFINSTPLIIQDGNHIITHAGVLIDNPLEENVSANIYGHLPSDKPMPIPDEGDGYTYWWDLYDGNYLILYGHLSTKDGKVRVNNNSYGEVNSIGLDTATVHGGPLSGYCLEDQKIYAYQSNVDYFGTLKKEFYKIPPQPCQEVLNWLKEKGF